ncbi:MAG TPA: hypothetical protein VL294_05055 [Pseudolysinimonas sp.]|jgi:hypothetical protein|nr:hypothetical protein [Pseudolysinimonas sp.]
MAEAWREPSRRIRLRFGTWAGRSWAGLTLIIGGGAAIAGASAANAYTLFLAAFGVTAHVLGWALLPAVGWRRVVVIAPSLVAMVSLLAGPAYLTMLVVPLLCWYLVRSRPLRVWPMAVFVIAAGVVLRQLFPGYSGMLTASGVAMFVVVGAAWAARAVHAASARPRRTLRRGERISP